MKFDELKAKFAALEAKYKAEQEAIENEFWADLGIKPEDRYPPDEAAARFEAALKACCEGKPIKQVELKEKLRERRKSKVKPAP